MHVRSDIAETGCDPQETVIGAGCVRSEAHVNRAACIGIEDRRARARGKEIVGRANRVDLQRRAADIGEGNGLRGAAGTNRHTGKAEYLR